MPTYAAFIGHQPHISVAELAATVPGFTLQTIADRTVALFSASEPLPPLFLHRLGGTIILCEELLGKTLIDDIPAILYDRLKDTKGKATFSLRTVGMNPRDVGNLYRKCKDYLKKKGRPSRYVGNERKAVLSVVLRSEGLLDGTHGYEITVIRHGKDRTLWVGITLDAQDIDAYTKRDMEKPVRDTSVGLLPPKLAQVLLNFGVWLAGGDAPRVIAAAPEKDTKKKGKKEAAPETRPFMVFDPFCGTGVIPLECLLRGYEILASDKAEKAVTGTQKNLDWMRRHWKILKSVVPSTVWKQDAVKPYELETLPDVIVTETSLGPNLRDRATSKEAQSFRSENEKLQEAFLKNAAETLPGVPLVVTWPVWYAPKGFITLEKVWEKLPKLGYEAVLPPGITPQSGRQSLLYRRADQLVGREIILLRPL